ncbi:hypothetical protein UK23_06090 [Lentzea aerocolonigenes]|uniref:Uncharacterized protein n=1 Tax=Lentzea aerocolonigenes TaxID=68170 RepID=A0A0F0H7I5_LENAE|nr:hypothetical protein [Lentzea aerocolonigenes]KJK51684.1 hypothetical protein UK23_06090 [Lentzea aerocolonigenes]
MHDSTVLDDAVDVQQLAGEELVDLEVLDVQCDLQPPCELGERAEPGRPLAARPGDLFDEDRKEVTAVISLAAVTASKSGP